MSRLFVKIFRKINYIYYYRYYYFINYLIFKIYKVNIGNNWRIDGKLSIKNDGNIKIGDNFRAFSGNYFNRIGVGDKVKITCSKNGNLELGNYVGISNSAICCLSSILIEDHVMIGGGSKIWDTNFHSLDPLIRGTKEDVDKNVMSSPIHIKKHAFIGAGSTILKGVVIGENSMIAAGSVVYKSVPDNQIWGGNPAIFLGFNPYRVNKKEV